jgi:hypothetical protein
LSGANLTSAGLGGAERASGFLGIGDSYHPLPWKALTYDESQGGFVVKGG